MSTPDPVPARAGRWLPLGNVLTSQLNTALTTAGAFVITPAVLNGLGDAAYGGWLLINSFVGYMRLLDQGTSTGTMKYGAGAYERGDERDLRRVFDTTSAIFLFVGLVAGLCAFGLATILPRFYPSILSDASSTILLLGVAMAIDLGVRTYPAALRTRSFFFVPDGVEILTYSIFKLGLTLYLARTLSYHVLALLTLGETLARNVLVVGASLWLCPFVRVLRPLRAEKEMFRRIALMGLAMSIIQVSDIVRFQLDAAVIGFCLPDSATLIAVFGVGTRLPSIIWFSVGVIGAILIPRFSGLSETGDRKGLLELLRRGSLATGLVSVFLCVNVAVFGPQFLFLWLKKPWVVQSGQILLMMLPAYYVGLLGGPSAGLLVGQGKLRGQTFITVVEAVANLVLSLALVRPFGIYGVAVGTIVPMVIVRAVLFPLVLRRDLGIAPREYAKLHARPLLLGLVYLALIGGFHFVRIGSYARFVAYGAASTAVFAALLFAGVPEVRRAVRARLRRGDRPPPAAVSPPSS